MAWMAFVSVLAILGIVLIGGGLAAFLIHMLVGVFDSGKNVDNASTTTTSKEVIDYKDYKQLEQSNSATVEKDYDFDAIDEAKAESEKALVESEQDKEDNFDLDEDTTEDEIKDIEARLKTENEAEDDDDFADLLDEIANDVVDEEKDKMEEVNAPKMDESLESYSIDEYIKTLEEEPVEEENVEEVVGNEELVEVPAVEEKVEENKVSSEELDNANKVIEDLKSQLEALNKQLAEAKVARPEVAIDMTEDECLARIATLEERLKNAKRDYKINSKEYRPLKKVMKDLERNQTKLRRRESIVANKKIALYGVSNYVDIDKEQAAQLANEIEFLEGLRLSVQHCEEVINENKDRYPILEHTNNILEEQISQLEADLERTNIMLQKIRDKKGRGEN